MIKFLRNVFTFAYKFNKLLKVIKQNSSSLNTYSFYNDIKVHTMKNSSRKCLK